MDGPGSGGLVPKVATVAVSAVGLTCVAVGAALLVGISAAHTPGAAPTTSDHVVTGVHDAPRVLRHCASATRPFVPATASVEHVTTGQTVLAEARDSDGVPGIPPLAAAGKQQFAWDAPGPRPGSSQGTVRLNAHTWPDGSALGNALLSHLRIGDRISLAGEGRTQCYRVTSRVAVPAVGAPQKVLTRYYRSTGTSQLAIVVCSGTRLRPGVWTERTLWFARPVALSGRTHPHAVAHSP